MANPPTDLVWEYGESIPTDIVWQQFEVSIPIDADRELTKLTFELHNSAEIDGFFDNLEVLKNLLNDKLLANNIIFMPIEEIPDGQPLSRIVYGAVELSTIVKVSYVPEGKIVGGNGNMQLQIRQSITDTLICTKTFLEGSDADADIVTDFGPIDKLHADVLASHSVRLVKTAEGRLPRGVLIVQWDII